jgi:hypothetical protein
MFEVLRRWNIDSRQQNDLIIAVSLKYDISVQRPSAPKDMPCPCKERVIEMNILLLLILFR